ncbi:MAG: SurA N-terminal domain-containing protein [Aquisalimonadaceae bacterium]
MLLAIRERAKGWIAWVVIILIGAAFALFGLSSYMGPSGESRAVATIDGFDISPDAVSQAYRDQRRQMEQMLGERFDPAMINERELRLQALNQVIDEYLLSEFIESQGLRLSDQDLAAAIRSQEVFHDDGRFSSERYHQLLRANRLSSNQYEAQVRRMALMEQVQSAIGQTALVTDRDVEQLVALQRQERDISYLTIPLSAFREAIAVDDDAVSAYYEENRGEFMSAESVRLDWVELRRDDLLADMEISDDDLRERYEQIKDRRFTEAQTRQVRHILVQLPENADAESEQAAQERIESLRSRIEAGESFADVAREASDDSASASRGGDLGDVVRGDMVEAFEEAAYSLAPGELSEPVRTRFGFHLIEVTAVQGGETTPFDEVRDQLRAELADERVNNTFFEQSSRLDELAFEWPDSLEQAADTLDLEIETSDWITRDGVEEGMGRHEAVVEAAFSELVLETRQNSDLIEIADDHYVVVRVRDHQPPEQRTLEDVAGEIRERLQNERAAEAAEERLQELRARLEAGETLEDLASANDTIRLEQAGFVSREADLPPAVLQEAFWLGRPADEGRSLGQAQLNGQDLALVVVAGVRDGDMESISDEERSQIRDQLRIAYSQEAIRDFVAELRAQAEIEIFEDRL